MKFKHLIFTLVVTGLIMSACTQTLSTPPAVIPTLITGLVVPPTQETVGEPQNPNSGAKATTSTPIPTIEVAPTATAVPATDWSELCWAQDPDKFPGTGKESYRVYFQDIATKGEAVLINSKGDNVTVPVYKVNFQDIHNFATTHQGFVQFEGRLITLSDTTDLVVFNGTEQGELAYREGSFWFYTYESCPDNAEARLMSIYTTAWGKWEGRVSGNEGANLEGYTMIIHDPADYNNIGVFNIDHPFTNRREEITGETFKIESCKNLTDPIRLDYQGEIRTGTIKNFSFGARNCISVTVGNFADGYKAQVYNDAMDNILVSNDDQLAHYIFPSKWSNEEILAWIMLKFPNITVDDPENVLNLQ